MILGINQLIPAPLKEKLTNRNSDVWLQKLLFTSPEYISIQAPSGTGKTTLMHCLYGLRSDYEGTINWNEENLRSKTGEGIAQLRSKEISIIFQDMRLFPELTAWENLEIKRSITNTTTPQDVVEWMNKLGIDDKKNSLAKTLSYGEQQRLAIIRALVQPFTFLLMDEPFSHLDQKNIVLAATLILEVVRQNNAGLLLADLDENSFFPYHKTLLL
jgi:ABC-type lipoprotein export system ATPase subunit